MTKATVVYIFFGGLGGALGSLMFLDYGGEVLPLFLVGFIYPASLWVGTVFNQKMGLLSIKRARLGFQVLLSLIVWPAALAGSVFTLFMVRHISFPAFFYPFFSYSSALLIVLSTQLISLRLLDVKNTNLSLLLIWLACETILVLALKVYQGWLATFPRVLGGHTFWLFVLLFIPLSSLIAGFYGIGVARRWGR